MISKFCVQWTLTPLHPPAPWRHCATCGVSRAFASSGKVRLNANGRKLDAWLIYRCCACSRTWNRTLVERRSVQNIPPADLEAMQRSDPSWVRGQEFDTDALKREVERVTQDAGVFVDKPRRPEAFGAPDEIELTLLVPTAINLRLDRLLSRELQFSRSHLQALHATGGLRVQLPERTALRRLVHTGMTVSFRSVTLSDTELGHIREALFAQ